jgi:hypothetical protein
MLTLTILLCIVVFGGIAVLVVASKRKDRHAR